MASSGILRRVALARTDVSEELSTSIIRVTRIGELGIMLVVTSNRRLLRRNTANVLSSPILVTLMIEALSYPKCRLLQKPHGVTSQKTPFYIYMVFSIGAICRADGERFDTAKRHTH
jgi:hypothetical protein